MPTGFEGLHIFDMSNTADPNRLGSVAIDASSTPVGCGSHTATLVPDVANGNLYVYNSGSNEACPGIDIVKIPLAAPGTATYLRREATGRACHDTGVILGDAMKAACAGHDGVTVLSMHADDGGSIEDPVVLWSKMVEGVTIGHSAALTLGREVRRLRARARRRRADALPGDEQRRGPDDFLHRLVHGRDRGVVPAPAAASADAFALTGTASIAVVAPSPVRALRRESDNDA